ncbi:ceramidase domain-containing protein [Salinarimonas ramus]|uniref:Membrane protein n=1 Tax=Salinarimonas ramus TaxID=690164 RepID=A0A917QEG9_9HYPH|nr:ceramidase domain-containing protein [Salinarimonas ramus]GGK46754.1 membrane protein [Salinarimonas ramus]
MDETGWCAPLDLYCERAGIGFWAEPVNAISNAAFLVAALLALAAWRRAGGRDLYALVLVGIVAATGVGSFLFHTFANRWSLLADVIPITLFIYGFFFLAMRRFLRLGALAAGIATAAFLGASAFFPALWRGLFGEGADVNGSVSYFPAALALLGVGALLIVRSRRAELVLANRKNRAWAGEEDEDARARTFLDRVMAPHAAGTALLLAAATFALSLVFRSIDVAVCGWLPLGTHFLWHVLNAVVLFLCVRAAIRARAGTGIAAA